ncbi:MAG TPA: hypothetical protein VGS22_02120 [Thermoanaerobaculia bacterium]|jgi:hypothetical protein|nr:hypothetical protein [Thermoanaerobaculia bacterium]
MRALEPTQEEIDDMATLAFQLQIVAELLREGLHRQPEQRAGQLGKLAHLATLTGWEMEGELLRTTEGSVYEDRPRSA